MSRAGIFEQLTIEDLRDLYRGAVKIRTFSYV